MSEDHEPNVFDYLATACQERCREYDGAPRTQATEAIQQVLSDFAAIFAVAAKSERQGVSDEILDLISSEVASGIEQQLTQILGTTKPTTRSNKK